MDRVPSHLAADDADVVAITAAIHAGDHDALRDLLDRRPELTTVRIGAEDGTSTTVLHIATDFPGHFPGVGATIRLLAAAGADVNARFAGPHTETPLHWAASSDDVEAAAVLVELGADVGADGAVLTGGPPLDDAIVFDQLGVAQLLVAAGATTRLFHAAALGLTDRVAELLADPPPPDEITAALWHACRQARVDAARLLVTAGGDPAWVGWDDQSPMSFARAHDDQALLGALGLGDPI